MQCIHEIIANNRITQCDNDWLRKVLPTIGENKIIWLEQSYKRTLIIKRRTSLISDTVEDDNLKIKNYIIGLWYYVHKQYETAFVVFSRNTNYIRCQVMLAHMYQYGQGTAQNFENMHRIMRIAANNDCNNAQYCLGMYYENGIGVEQNIENAIEWYNKSASLGNANAQYNLAIILYEGLYDTEPDIDNAISLLIQSANGNNCDAQYYLGKHYSNQNNFLDAERWLMMAVYSGNAKTMIYLAKLYENQDVTLYIDQIINLYMSIYIEYEDKTLKSLTSSDSKDDENNNSDEEKEHITEESTVEQSTEQTEQTITYDILAKQEIQRLIGINDIGFEYLKRRLIENEKLHNIINNKL
jgi:TPR repeat protein